MQFFMDQDKRAHIAKQQQTFCGVPLNTLRKATEREMQQTTRNCMRCWQKYLTPEQPIHHDTGK